MNWTGGSLVRSRSAKASLTAVQKKHFAKARAQQHSGKRTQPPSRTDDDLLWRPSHPSPSFNKRQRTLEEFRETEHLARRLESIRPRPSQFSQLKRPRPAVNAGPRSHISISSREPSSSPASARSERCASRQACGPEPEIDGIEAYKRRLLGMKDWIGIEHATPPKINFRAVEDRELIGKRRRLSQIPDFERRLPPPQRVKRTDFFTQNHQHPQPFQDFLSQANISVRIGSAVDRSVRHPSLVHGAATQRSGISSDEMLLDDEPNVQREAYPNPFLESQPRYLEVSSPRSSVGGSVLPSDNNFLPTPFRKRVQPHGVTQQTSPHFNRPLSSDQSPGLSEDGRQAQSLGLNERHPVAQKTLEESNEREAETIRHGQDVHTESQPADEPDTPHSSNVSVVGNTADDSTSLETGSMITQPAEQAFNEVKPDSDPTQEEAEDLPEVPKERGLAAEEDEEMWTKYVNLNPDEPLQDLPPTPKDTNANVSTNHGQNISTHNITGKYGSANVTSAQTRQPIPDEEAIWRSFVFGDGDMTNEWTFDDPILKLKDLNDNTIPPSSPLARAQMSTAAEVGTSPILQNPHLLAEDDAPAAQEADASALPTNISTGAEADDSEFRSSQLEEEDGEVLDNLLIELSSDAAIQGRISSGSAHDGPSTSSIQAHASSSSSNRVNPFPSCSSVLSSAAKPQTGGQRTRTLIFRTPPKYAHGDGLSECVEPVVLGKGVGTRRKGRGKAGGRRPGKAPVVEVFEDDDIEDD